MPKMTLCNTFLHDGPHDVQLLGLLLPLQVVQDLPGDLAGELHPHVDILQLPVLLAHREYYYLKQEIQVLFVIFFPFSPHHTRDCRNLATAIISTV